MVAFLSGGSWDFAQIVTATKPVTTTPKTAIKTKSIHGRVLSSAMLDRPARLRRPPLPLPRIDPTARATYHNEAAPVPEAERGQYLTEPHVEDTERRRLGVL